MPPPSALLAVADELARLRGDAEALQAALPPPADAPGRAALQRLDALTQSLDALATFAGEVGRGADPAAAAAALPLKSLADRLAGGRGAAEPAGDLELF